MRNYIILLIAILSIACAKEPQYATVTFDVRYVQSGTITKVSSGAVSEALAASMPTGPFQIHLVSKTNPLRSYDITTGSSVTIAVDDYTVTGSVLNNAGVKLKQAYGGTGFNAETRLFQDFASRMYFIEAKDMTVEMALNVR